MVTSPPQTPVSYTPEEALALYVDGRYTENSYMLMQSGAKKRHANIYPPYNILREAKKRCYPEEAAISISDISAEVKLQSLVDHTVQRIFEIQKEVITQISLISHNITMTYKWGCDGSANHSTYRQKFSQGEEKKN